MDSNAGNGKNNSRFSPEEADSYVIGQIKYIEDLIKKFEKMGTSELKRDGKVPEKCKTFFNSRSSMPSNRDAVLKNLEKYLDFFKTMLIALNKLSNDTQMMQSVESDPLSIVDHLKSLLFDLNEVARSGLPETDSFTLYYMHSEFIEEFSQLYSMVNKLECIFLRKKILNLTKLLDDCQDTMRKFQVNLKEFQNIKRNMEKQIAELMTENEKLRQRLQSQMALNAQLKE